MSLLKYFNKSEKSSTSNLSDVCESMKSNLPSKISANELEKIHESKGCSGKRKEKTNGLCRERQARNCKICWILQSYSGYQKIPTKVPTFNRKYRASMGKKLQKIYAGTEEDESIQCGTNNWKS